jgi:hypothetical protein
MQNSDHRKILFGVGAASLVGAIGWYLYQQQQQEAQLVSGDASTDSKSNGENMSAASDTPTDSKAERRRLKALKKQQDEEDAKLQSTYHHQILIN